MTTETESEDNNYEYIAHEYQVNKPNGDIDFVTVYDLPMQVSLKWVTKKYPGCEISLYKTYQKP